MRPRKSSDGVQCEMQMTPMIDIVFQLLAFFVMSFKIVELEGDLAIKMPIDKSEGPVATAVTEIPLRVVLTAGPGGNLSGVRVGEERLADTHALRTHFERLAARDPESAQHTEVDLVCDDDLDYQHMLAALTAVSGKREAGKVVPLVKDVRLRKPGRTL